MTGAAEQHAPPGAFARFVGRRAPYILAAVAAITALALGQLVDLRTGALRLQVDPSLDPLMAPDNSARRQYEQALRRFGADEMVVVAVHADDVYRPEVLATVDRLGRSLRELEHVSRVQSLTTVPLPRSENGEIVVQKLTPEELADPAGARLRERVTANPLLLGSVVSPDARTAALFLSLDTRSEQELLASGVAERIRAVAEAAQRPGLDVWVTGAPIVRAAASRTVVEQLRWVIPAIATMLTLLLALAFRSLRGVLLPLATVLVALVWLCGALCVLHRPLNLITSLVPPLVLCMGLAYVAHVLTEFEGLLRSRPQLDGETRAKQLVQEITAPVLLTGFTTAIGMLALALNDLRAIREFALLAAVGAVVAALLALTFVPAALRYARPGRVEPLPGERWFTEGSRRAGRFGQKHRTAILVAASLVFVAAAVASTRIRIGDQFVGIFRPQAMVRSDFEATNRAIGGVTPLSVVVDGIAADAFVQPRNLQALDRLEEWLRRQPEVGHVTGLPDHVRVLMGLFLPEVENFPPAPEALKQVLFFGDGESLRGVVNGDRSSAQLSVRLTVDDTASISAFLDRLHEQLATLPAPLAAHATGSAALMAQSVESVAGGQLQSIGLALLLIYLCLALQFTSFSIGVLASLPTLLQTAIYFGVLGACGVTLNATTGLVESLVLGLAVDDTIHYLSRFNAAAKRSGSETQAATDALAAVIRPTTLTKAVLAGGFLMLVTGQLANQVLFGWLAAFALAAAWIVDVYVTPAFMSGVRVVTLWDSLQLDLGANLQTSIPLFQGLSNRQARIFALMSNLKTQPAGARVMSQGDAGGDVYVVIEGELSVWTQGEGGRREMARLKRGAVLGETGYFGQKRTANVDAITPVRLLRFDTQDQERICRRYPRIAARVFLNLNQVQAERRASLAA
ncbi:MAG TPA: MMPL family transporter [Candidatus Binatia bacterium]|nr:MMPL family transporter [Candidatus Binatia bacterium]